MIALLAVAALGQSYVTQRTFAQPVYQQGYQQGYANQVYDVRTIVVPVEQVEAQYIGLVGQAQRVAERRAEQQQQVQQAAQQANATTDAKIDQLAKLIQDLQRRIDASEPPIPSKPAASPAEPTRPALPVLAPAGSEAAPPPPTISQASTNLTHAGATVLARHCAECHGKNGTRKGGRQFFDRSGQVLQADATDLSAMRDAILAGSMPPASAKRSPLTLREFAAINEFINQQAGSLALSTTNQRKKIR